MSTQSPQLDQADRELLVAYLDGELSAEDCAVVESRLTSDELFRHELQDLQRAWEALNELPRHAAPEGFTRTTIEMVAIAAEEEVQSATMAIPAQRRRYVGRLLAVISAALLAGILLALALWPDRNRQLIHNLPVIENVDAYRHLEDMDFLQQLHANLGDRLARVSPIGEEDVAHAWQEWQAVSQDDPAERRARIQRISRLDAAMAGNLQAKWNRYERLEDKDRERIHQLHRDLLQSDQSPALFATVARFGDLLNRHSAGDRIEFRSKSLAEEKLAVVDAWVGQEENRNLNRIPFSVEDRRKLVEFLQQNPVRRRVRPPERRPPTPEELQALEEERAVFRSKLEEVIGSLSSQAQEAIKEDQGDWALYRWLRENVGSWQRRPEDEELFLSIDDNDAKAHLLLMPERDMRRDLRQRFFAPFADGPRIWRGGPPGRGEGRGGRDGGPPGRRPPPASEPSPGDARGGD